MDKDILGYVLLLIVFIGLVQYEVYSYKRDDSDYASAYVRILEGSGISADHSKAIIAVIQSETNRSRSLVASVANIGMFVAFSVFVSFRVRKRKNKNDAVGIKSHA